MAVTITVKVKNC